MSSTLASFQIFIMPCDAFVYHGFFCFFFLFYQKKRELFRGEEVKHGVVINIFIFETQQRINAHALKAICNEHHVVVNMLNTLDFPFIFFFLYLKMNIQNLQPPSIFLVIDKTYA